MIHVAATPIDESPPDAGPTPAQHQPVLIDFCRERARRNKGSRFVDTWELVHPEAGRAVSDWRMGRGLTVGECARAAGVSSKDWTSVECPSPHRIGRAFPIWRALTWVMAAGGPKFHLNGLPDPEYARAPHSEPSAHADHTEDDPTAS